MASMIRAIVAGSGSRRPSILWRSHVALRFDRARGLAGQGSFGSSPRSTARRTRLRLARRRIEQLATLDRHQKPRPVTIRLRLGAERLAALAPIDGPAHEPRLSRGRLGATVLDTEDADLLVRPWHSGAPPAS